MATIANLIVEISAQSIKLQKGLNAATARIKKFAKSTAQILKNIAVGLTAGGVVAITAIMVMVNRYAARIDKLAKTSAKLGVTVAALQKLQYQAELTGVSVETMNMAMQRMVRRVSEATRGTGEAKDALRELGLDAQKLSQLSPDQQFYKISEAMKQIGSQGDKVRLAMKIFDTEGVALVNTMNGNLAQMGAEFDTLGIKVSQSQARMVEAYQDSKTKLGAIFSGFGIQLTAQLAEPFKKLIEWITEAVQKMGGMDKVAKFFADAMINGIANVIEGVGKLVNGLRSIKVWLLEIKLAAQQAVKNLTFLNAVEAGGQLFNKDFKINIFGDTSKTKADIDDLKKSMADTNDFADEAKAKADELRNLIGKNSGDNKIDAAIKAYDASAKSVTNLADAANQASYMADANKNAAKASNNLADAANKAAKALAPKVQASKNAKITNLYDFKARMNANRINANVADDPFSKFRGAKSPGIYQDEKPEGGRVKSIQEYIDESPAGKVLQQLRQGPFGRNSGNTSGYINGQKVGLKPDSASFRGKTYKGDELNKLLNGKATTKITLEMVTDHGKVAGELVGNQDFINEMSRLQQKQTNKAAKMAAN